MCFFVVLCFVGVVVYLFVFLRCFDFFVTEAPYDRWIQRTDTKKMVLRCSCFVLFLIEGEGPSRARAPPKRP